MIRIITAIIAIASIVIGTMLVTQQGLFAESKLGFDKYGDSGEWSNQDYPNAYVSLESDGAVVTATQRNILPPPPPPSNGGGQDSH